MSLASKLEENISLCHLCQIHMHECCLMIFRYNNKDTIMKEIIDKLCSIKIKNYCSVKDNVKIMRR